MRGRRSIAKCGQGELAYRPLKVGGHHFAHSDYEDDDRNNTFYFRQEVFKRTGNRKYLLKNEEIQRILEWRYQMRPAIIDIKAVASDPVSLRRIIELLAEDSYFDSYEVLTLLIFSSENYTATSCCSHAILYTLIRTSAAPLVMLPWSFKKLDIESSISLPVAASTYL